MLSRLRPRVNYANVMATVAVFLALGGGAYAATQLPKNSVGTKQLKRDAVTSPKVKNGSLLAKDFKKGQLPRGAGEVKPVQLKAVGPAVADCTTQTGHYCRIDQTEWQTPSDDSEAASYGKDSFGIVHVTGGAEVVNNFVCPILTLPAGMRPQGRHYFPIIIRRDLGGGISKTFLSDVMVEATGDVSCPRNTVDPSSPSTNYSAKSGDVIDLSTITFRAFK